LRVTVRFFWDYTAFPLWTDGTVLRALPDEFRDALQAWSDEGTEHFLSQLDGAELPPGWVGEWATRGRVLAVAATQLVGDIEYANRATNETELILRGPMEDGYATPEEAALSGYTPGAEAHVVSVEMIEDWHARVVVDTARAISAHRSRRAGARSGDARARLASQSALVR